MPDTETANTETAGTDTASDGTAAATDAASATDSVSLSEANKKAKAARLDGEKSGQAKALQSFLEASGLGSIDELQESLRKLNPEVQRKDQKVTERLKAEHAKELEAIRAENEQIKAERDEGMIWRGLSPVMVELNVRDAEAALLVVKHKTSHGFQVRDGRTVVVDRDGDVVSEDPQRWLRDTLKKDEFSYLLKPVAGGGGARVATPGTKTNDTPAEVPNLGNARALAEHLAAQAMKGAAAKD